MTMREGSDSDPLRRAVGRASNSRIRTPAPRRGEPPRWLESLDPAAKARIMMFLDLLIQAARRRVRGRKKDDDGTSNENQAA
jgi:hypothetical protein